MHCNEHVFYLSCKVFLDMLKGKPFLPHSWSPLNDTFLNNCENIPSICDENNIDNSVKGDAKLATMECDEITENSREDSTDLLLLRKNGNNEFVQEFSELIMQSLNL